MPKWFDEDICKALWEQLSVAVVNVTQKIEAPRGSVQLIGFADLQIFIAGQAFLLLPRTSLKLMRGRLHFDPQVIMGKNEKLGVPFPTWRPLTAEARVVLDELLAEVPEIKELIDQANVRKEISHG